MSRRAAAATFVSIMVTSAAGGEGVPEARREGVCGARESMPLKVKLNNGMEGGYGCRELLLDSLGCRCCIGAVEGDDRIHAVLGGSGSCRTVVVQLSARSVH